MTFSSVVGGCGGTVEPGGCDVAGYESFCLDVLPLPKKPAVASLSLLLLDSISSGSLPIVPAKMGKFTHFQVKIIDSIIKQFKRSMPLLCGSLYLLANKIARISTAAQSARPMTHSSRLRQFVLRRLSFVTYNFSPLKNANNKPH